METPACDAMTRRTPELPIVERAASHAGRTAIVAQDGRFPYQDLMAASHGVAAALLEAKADLDQARVAYLVPPSFLWVATQWGVWRAGGVAVPLAVSHPPPELEYALTDSGAVAGGAPPGADSLASPRTGAPRSSIPAGRPGTPRAPC